MPEDNKTPSAGGTPSAGTGSAPGQSGETPGGQQAAAPQNFDSWLQSQDVTIKGLIDSHVGGLRSALDAERTQRKDFEKQLKELAGKLEKGSDGQKQAEELAGKVARLELQAAFYDAAHAAGVSNLRLAWLAAQEAGLIDDKGQANLPKLKELFPELFGSGSQTGTAGSNATNPANAGRGARLTREMIRNMTADQINNRSAEVSAVLESKP